jgi:hypothetical protein
MLQGEELILRMLARRALISTYVLNKMDQNLIGNGKVVRLRGREGMVALA